MLVAVLSITHTVFEVLGILSAVHAVMGTRTAQGAIAWAISLVTFPYVALPLYWVFGRSKFQGYVRARQLVDEEVVHVAPEVRKTVSHFAVAMEDERGSFRVLTQLTDVPAMRGNEVELLIDGDATFASILAGIDRAREYCLVQFFIIHDDEIGRDFQQRLIAKAKEGVQVRLLYDEIGCHALPRRYLRRLREAGVHVSGFKTTQGITNRFQLNFRNHRKMVIVDGKEAWVGGHNVGDEYLGRNPKFGHWRDTHVRIAGPAVLEVQLSFVEDWYWATKELPSLNWTACDHRRGDRTVHVVPSGPSDDRETATLTFLEAITGAKERVWIASPYFVPDEGILCALKLADLRGVDVRILIPDNPDHVLVYLSAFTFLKELEGTGIGIYRYEHGFLHQKVVLVDDRSAIVGTANLDNRSLRLNFEISVLVIDEGFAGEVERMLVRDFAQARLMDPAEFDEKPLWFRFAARGARLLAPIQ